MFDGLGYAVGEESVACADFNVVHGDEDEVVLEDDVDGWWLVGGVVVVGGGVACAKDKPLGADLVEFGKFGKGFNRRFSCTSFPLL